MDVLFEYQQRMLAKTTVSFVRYKYADLDWHSRVFGIVGPRGVGKTTMLLQHIKQHLSTTDTLYITADHLYFATHTLAEVADAFYKQGGKHLFIDEVHKANNWSQQLKQMIDTYSDMQIVFTGSSVLDIYHGLADLSRRAPVYEMQGLSFREYLALYHHIDTTPVTLEDILRHRVTIPGVQHPLPLFRQYLQEGYYPFAHEGFDYTTALMQVVTRTMENDIPMYANLSAAVARRLKMLLVVVAESVPFKPNYAKLAQVTGISRNDISEYLYYMERAGMLMSLRDATAGIRGIGKVEKIYLDNTNLMYVLAPQNAEIGNVRETFFLNQMRVRYSVESSEVSDFVVNDCTFEVGGKNKGKRQIATVANAYIVKDDIEFGYQQTVPLWAFGLTY